MTKFSDRIQGDQLASAIQEWAKKDPAAANTWLNRAAARRFPFAEPAVFAVIKGRGEAGIIRAQ